MNNNFYISVSQNQHLFQLNIKFNMNRQMNAMICTNEWKLSLDYSNEDPQLQWFIKHGHFFYTNIGMIGISKHQNTIVLLNKK